MIANFRSSILLWLLLSASEPSSASYDYHNKQIQRRVRASQRLRGLQQYGNLEYPPDLRYGPIEPFPDDIDEGAIPWPGDWGDDAMIPPPGWMPPPTDDWGKGKGTVIGKGYVSKSIKGTGKYIARSRLDESSLCDTCDRD